MSKGVFALLLALFLGMGTAYAHDFSAVCSGKTLYFNIIDATNHYVEITCPGDPGPGNTGWDGYTKPTGNITLPSNVTYNGVTYSVKAIGRSAFEGCSGLTGSLTIPNSVTVIRQSAFVLCTGFTGSLTLSSSLTTIEVGAFWGCSGFTGTLNIPNSVISIGDDVFHGCSSFSGTLTIPNSVNNIGFSTFEGCSGFTGSLTIPNSVASIGSWAFSGCSGLNDLIIGSSITTIGQYAFDGCSQLSSMTVLPEVPPTLETDVFQNVPKTIPVHVPCESLSAYLNASGWNDFTNYQCFHFDFLGACSTGQTLYYNIIDATNHYVEITYPGTNSSNPWGGYTQPTGNITLPSTVTYNGVPYTVTKIGDNAFVFCTDLTGSLTIPNSVTEIGENAFYNCTGFTGTLTLGNSLTTIGASAFQSCCDFTGSLNIPNSVNTIGAYAFDNCSSMTGSLTIPNAVTTIGEYAFRGCSSFNGTLTLGNSVSTIGEQAFSFCMGFTGSLTIPSSVTTIAAYAFMNCSGFTSITALPETPPTLGTSVFRNIPTNIPVYVPCASLEDYQSVSGWSAFTNYQCIPEPTLTVYDGTATNDHIPAYIYYFDDFTRSQFVIPAADLAEMTNNSITSMTFYTTNNNVSRSISSDADVYLMEVNYTQISAFEPKESAIIVFSGRFSIESTEEGGEMTILFDTPYTYQGGNLLVGVENTQDNGWLNIHFYGQTVNGASISGSNASSTGTIPANQQNFIPKTTFSFVPVSCEAITSYPWSTNFDSYAGVTTGSTNNLPVCWNFINTTTNSNYSGYPSIFNQSTYAHSGNNYLRFYSYYYVDPEDQYAILPEMEGLNGKQIKLYARGYNAGNSFKIGMMTDPNDVSTFVEIATQTLTTSYQEYEYTLGEGNHVAIMMEAAASGNVGVFIDDITIEEIPVCLAPTNLEASDITGHTATLSWSGDQTSYNVRYKVAGGFFDDFENGLDGWTVIRNGEGTNDTDWQVFNARTWGGGSNHSGDKVASSFSWRNQVAYNVDNWLITPQVFLNGTLKFWVRCAENEYPDHYDVYVSTSSVIDINNFTLLHEPGAPTETWTEITVDLSAFNGAQGYIAIRHQDNDKECLWIDDFGIYTGSDWVELNGVTSPVTIEGLALSTAYEWQVRGMDCDGSGTYTDWSAMHYFTTDTPPIFITNGNWNNDGCWNTGSVPPAGSDVIIQANVTVPAGYLAVANEVNFDGGSITVADGGQLKHNTMDLVVTMKKNIAGYDDANSQNNYYLLAVPFLSVQVPTAMTANPGSDFYRFDPSETGAEWRNHKEEPITFVQRRYGYLYANPESVELSLTGITLSVSNEFTMNYTVDYTEGSGNPSNGWALLGNPFTYNAYVYRFDSNNEFVPMPIMMYDEEGELQTIYGGPVAPMQGFFVHVTETTTVYFSGTAPHEDDYVDLGLPSGLPWATCNVGANAPEEYGDYFAWGETQPKDTYDWSTYQYCNGSNYTMTKYCDNSNFGYNGFTDNLTILLPEDDAATANWGSGWRMPTEEEWRELYNNTTHTWAIQNGVNGRLFTATNGNSLFLPAGGYCYNSSLRYAGNSGYYWSSSLYTDFPDIALYFYVSSDFYDLGNYDRSEGRSVRPVRVGSQN